MVFVLPSSLENGPSSNLCSVTDSILSMFIQPNGQISSRRVHCNATVSDYSFGRIDEAKETMIEKNTSTLLSTLHMFADAFQPTLKPGTVRDALGFWLFVLKKSFEYPS